LDAFDKLANSLHQDTLLVHGTLDAAIRVSVRSMSPSERTALTSYLDELLGGAYTDQHLADVWNRSPAGSGGFEILSEGEGGAAWFFGQLRNAVAASLP
jgi:hypothetical protein